MIPILKVADGPAALYADFLAELRLRGFEGDITHAHADRTVLATDNSIYQVPPQAAVFPRNETRRRAPREAVERAAVQRMFISRRAAVAREPMVNR